jgi:hypothetical protein
MTEGSSTAVLESSKGGGNPKVGFRLLRAWNELQG